MAEESRNWLKIAFVIQSLLLVSIIGTLCYVTSRFNHELKDLLDRNLKAEESNREKAQELNKMADSFVIAELNAAFELRRNGKTQDADLQIENAQSVEPDSWLVWRDKSQAMIDEHRAQEAWDGLIQAAKRPDGPDLSAGPNLVTEAMIQCALGNKDAAKDLRSREPASYREDPTDQTALDSTCRPH